MHHNAEILTHEFLCSMVRTGSAVKYGGVLHTSRGRSPSKSSWSRCCSFFITPSPNACVGRGAMRRDKRLPRSFSGSGRRKGGAFRRYTYSQSRARIPLPGACTRRPRRCNSPLSTQYGENDPTRNNGGQGGGIYA